MNHEELIARVEARRRMDTRPCRHRFPHGHTCGRPEADLPSHGESFASHPYAPERRSGQDRRQA